MRPSRSPGSCGSTVRRPPSPRHRVAAGAGEAPCGASSRRGVELLLAALLALAACDAPTALRPAADVSGSEPLRGQYGLVAPMRMADGRTLYWAQLSFYGKHDPSEGQNSWTGTYSVKDGGGCLANVAWGTFALAQDRVGTGSTAFSDVVLASDRRTLQATIAADGTPVRVQLVLGAASPL